jgi:lincosamide nucleotidyltransferase A/C/D/E
MTNDYHAAEDADMPIEVVLEIYTLLTSNDIDTIIDGGWGIDAMLGRQTRPHGDLDIAVRHKDVEKLRALLSDQGYQEKPNNDTSDYNFVLADSEGHELDVHSYTFDAEGNNIYGIAYPLESLKGSGNINGISVKCIAPEWVIKFHENYEPDEEDRQDIKALCHKFNLKEPANY